MPTGINDRGQVVGHYITASSNGASGFLYSKGVYTTINDPLGGYSTSADGINNRGEIVGHYETSFGGPVFMFSYRNGVYTTIDVPAGQSPVPAAVNDRGQIVGENFLASPTHHDSFVFPSSLGKPPTTGLDIRNTGCVLAASDATDLARVALLSQHIAASFVSAGDMHDGTLISAQHQTEHPLLSLPHG